MKNTCLIRLFSLVFLVFSIFTLSTCEIGLGEAVDTTKPTITITYPLDNSVIRGEFLMQGSATDDTALKDVTLSFEKKIDGMFKEAASDCLAGDTSCDNSVNERGEE